MQPDIVRCLVGSKLAQVRTNELQETDGKIAPRRGLIQRLWPEKVPQSLWQKQQKSPNPNPNPQKTMVMQMPQEPVRG